MKRKPATLTYTMTICFVSFFLLLPHSLILFLGRCILIRTISTGTQPESIEPAVDETTTTTTTTSTTNQVTDRRRNQDQAVVNGISVILALLEFKKPTQDNSEQVGLISLVRDLILASSNFVVAWLHHPTSSFYFTQIPFQFSQLTQLDAERLAHGVSNVLLALQPRLKEVLELLQLDPPPSSPAGLDLYQATSGNGGGRDGGGYDDGDGDDDGDN